FNISPRAVWTERALAKALQCTAGLSGDLLLMAGNPPLLESTAKLIFDLHAQVIEQVRDRFQIISVDTEKQTLANCLQRSEPPDVIKINDAEHRGVDQA